MERPNVELVAVRRRDRTVWFFVGALVAAVALAILKPWNLGGADRPTLAPVAVAATATPTTTPEHSTSSPGPATCFSHEAWRLVTAERTSGRDTRSWIAVAPVGASGPSERRIPTVSVVADQLLGIGLCTPADIGDLARSTYVWVAEGRTVVPLRLVDLPPVVGFGLGEGQIYGPPLALASPSGSWPNGRYAIEVRGTASRSSSWFAFRVSRPSTASADRPAGGSSGTVVATGPSRAGGSTTDSSGTGIARCFSDATWRLVTVDKVRGGEIRSWTVVDPARAGGATDPSIPKARIDVQSLIGMGYCAPLAGSWFGAEAEAYVWLPALHGAPLGLRLTDLPRLPPDPATAELGTTYGPPPAMASRRGSWPEGRYVIEIRDSVGDKGSVWFALDVTESTSGSGGG